MTPMPWFRVYSEILDDRKIKRIAKKTNQPKATILGVWITLLALANESEKRGTLNISENIPYTIEDIEDETEIERELLEHILNEFEKLGMINGADSIEIANWNKRQFKSDNVAERVRRHRQKRYSNVIDTDTESDTDTDTDSEEEGVENIFTVYESEIGIITPAIAEKLKELEAKYPCAWIAESMRIASQNNARRMAYFTTILERWRSDGYKPNSPRASPQNSTLDAINRVAAEMEAERKLENE